ncbi:Uncharacterised protein [Starkeya nomas]|uniref:DUF3309 domain-containing protein n=1 Tax=Starkeya nomas TaxID=2666134 RepID=A0A5S9P1T9_9HYPH|nr:hypothetical protein [Starkeya nomas]CAA0097246.1 Uncharacterised protein [Starkeya nomas]
MQTIILIILVLLLLIATGFISHRAYGVRGALAVLVVALIVLAIVGFISDEAAVGPGVPPIIQQDP